MLSMVQKPYIVGDARDCIVRVTCNGVVGDTFDDFVAVTCEGSESLSRKSLGVESGKSFGVQSEDGCTFCWTPTVSQC